MKILRADFLVSNTRVEKCPKETLPEYAFIGASNVGKSTLINMLTGRKKLAKTSGTPGKTRLINHFKINNSWFLVDLPGFGYAKVSKKLRKDFQGIINGYFQKRKQLVCAFVLIDIRHKPKKNDLNFMEFMGKNQIPFCIVFTKADKLKSVEIDKNTAHYKKEMLKEVWEKMPPFFVSSAVKKTGKEEILDFIEKTNQSLKNSDRPSKK